MINEQVYGVKENWYVPREHSEFGTTQTAEVYYYNKIDADDKLKLKVANFNTLEGPVTTIRSQMNGQYSGYTYAIRNNWIPTEFTMDNSIVQFGIGSQSGLSNQEWWYVDRVYGASDPSQNDPPVLKNTDSYEITNMCLATTSSYAPYEFYSYGQSSILAVYDNGWMYWQGIVGQTFNTPDSVFGDWYSTQYGFPTGYIYSKLVTQIPVKNLKLTPVIFAYNSALDNYKKFTSIQNYLTEKSSYPYIFCIKVQFKYRDGYFDDVRYEGTFNCYPWFFNSTSFLNGYGYRYNNADGVYGNNVYYPNRGDKTTGEGITVAGRPGYDHGPNGSMLGNEIYWVGHNDSSTTNSFTIGQGGRVLQTPDFKFVLGTKNLFYCDVSAMSDNDITKGIRKQLASFGLFFVDGISDIDLPLDDEKTFLGILEDGVAYGRYSNGEKNRDQAQWNWDTMEENSYDPDNPPTPSPFIPDPNGYNDGMSLSQLDGFETATQRYNLYKAQAHQVFAALWSVWDPFDESDPDLNAAQIDLKTKKMFLTSNPLDCVIGLKYFPVPADMIGTGSDTPVKLGALTLHQAGSSSVEIQCKMAQNSYIHDCGSVYCAPQYQAYSGISDSWIDQYVGFELYLPFCGSVKLDTATYIGKWVNVQYHIDYITGACTAYIGVPSAVNRSVSEFMEIRSGNCAIDVPISGIQQATLEANMFNATQQLKGAALRGVSSVVGNLISTAGKAAAKDIGGAVSAGFSTVGSIAGSVNEIQSAKFELQHTQLPARMIGSASALSGSEGYLSPMLIVTEPRLIEVPDNYGHTVGFACMRYGKLKDISSGYTEINSIDLDGIACTAEEKSIIRSVLAGGIYL